MSARRPPHSLAHGALALAALLLVAGCASTHGLAPRSTPQRPEALAASATLADASVSPAAWPEERWWAVLGDPQLDALMDEALRASPTLELAQARTRAALAPANAAGAARYPELDVSGSSARELFPAHSLVPPPYGGAWNTLNELRATLSWEPDFWGANRSTYRQALGEARAAALDTASARLALTTSIAHTYVALAQAYLELDVAQNLQQERQQIYALTRERNAAGLDSRIELKQAESALPESQEQIAQLDEQIARLRNALAALLGEGPDRARALPRPRLVAPAQLALPSRLPAELLGRRPDILALRWRVEAAQHGIAAAQARFYPDVSLSALVGLQSLGTGAFAIAANREIGVAPAFTLPIFDAGRRRAQLAARDAEYDAAVAQYDQRLADALREVVDQLVAYRSVVEQRGAQRSGLATAQDAYDLALLRYREGLGNYLQVLTTHQALLAQRTLDAQLAARALDVTIDLAHALGGGMQGEAQ